MPRAAGWRWPSRRPRPIGRRARGADAHERRAGIGHHRLDIGEVEVDQTRGRDQVGDPLDTGQQHLVGRLEGVEDADGAVGDRQQPVVRDDDQRVDFVAQRVDAALSLDCPPPSLERERAGDDADGQRAEGTRDAGDDGCAARTGAAAHRRSRTPCRRP